MESPVVEINRLIGTGDFDAARRICLDTIERRPRDFAPYLWLARVEVDAERQAEAMAAAEAAIQRGAPEARVVRVHLAAATRSQDVQAQLRLLARLAALEPGEPQWWRRALKLQLAAMRDADALVSLGRLVALAPETRAWEALALIAGRTAPHVFLAHLDALVAEFPDTWVFRIARAAALADADRMDPAWADVDAAVRIEPNTPFPPPLQRAIGRRMRACESDARRFDDLRVAHPKSGALLWSKVLWLENQWDAVGARALVRANRDWARATEPPPELWAMLEYLEPEGTSSAARPASPARYHALLYADQIEAAIDAVPERIDHALLRQASVLSQPRFLRLRPSRDPGEMTIAGPERPEGTVVVFTGIQDQAWVPMHVLDRFFAELGLTAVYLRDYRRLAFMDGLKSLAPTLRGTVDALSRQVASEVGKPVYTFGASAGGMAAVVYAQGLGASASLLFSPPTTFDPDLVEKMGDTRGDVWFRRLLAHIDPQAFDLGRILAAMPPSYRLTAYANSGNVLDCAHVERLQGMPRTRVRLLEGSAEHNSLGVAAAQENLLVLFREAFGLRASVPA